MIPSRLFSLLLMAVALVGIACGAAATAQPSPTSKPMAVDTPAAEAPAAAPTQVPIPASLAKSGVLRVGTGSDNYRLDPKEPGYITVGLYNTNANIFDHLTYMDANLQLQPMLAESWEYNLGTNTWRFHLRQNVTFHDGKAFTSEDVVEALADFGSVGIGRRFLNIDQNSSVVVDDYTVDVTPIKPFVHLPGALSKSNWGIRAAGSDPFQGEYVGTGPFKFVQYARDDRIIGEKFPDYWGEGPFVDRIEFRFIPDPNTRVLALQAGEVDVIYDVPPDAASHMQRMADIQVLPSIPNRHQFLQILLTGEPPHDITRDNLVREAIGYAIDRQALGDIAWDGFGSPSRSHTALPALGRHADRVAGYTYDPNRARALLEQAGWIDADDDGIRENNGRELTLELVNGYPNGPENGQTPEVVQAHLRDVGIDVQIALMPDNASWSARNKRKEGALFLKLDMRQKTPEVCFPFTFFYGRDETNPGVYWNISGPGTAGWGEYEDEVDACNSSLDPDEAAMHAANADAILTDKARAVIPLVEFPTIWAARANIENVEPHPQPIYMRWNLPTIRR